MNFIVTNDCIRLGLRAGAIAFRDLHVGASSPALRAQMVEVARAIRTRFPNAAAIRSDPLVLSFREIIRQAGANPKKEQPSIERLMTFAHKRGDLPVINNLVEAYNLVSLQSSCSLGAHDLDRIRLPISLRLLDGSESFTPLGSEEPVSVIAGEFGYVDSSNRLLCRLDVLQAEFSKVTEATVNALLIVEGTAVHSSQSIRQAFDDAIDQVTRYCGGKGEIVAFPE